MNMQIGKQSCISIDHDLCYPSTFSSRNSGICYREKNNVCGGREEKLAGGGYIVFQMRRAEVSATTTSSTEAFQDLRGSVAIAVSCTSTSVRLWDGPTAPLAGRRAQKCLARTGYRDCVLRVLRARWTAGLSGSWHTPERVSWKS